jgi:predicted CXXCH cytochrome family protein
MNRFRSDIYLALFATILIFSIGCSHKTASFFFDGVPYRDYSSLVKKDTLKAVDTGNQPLLAQAGDGPVIFQHAPYVSKKCLKCHDPSTSSRLLKEPQPDLCYECHDDYHAKFKFLHDPVVKGNCTKCHEPHAGNDKNLLIRQGQQMCLSCHDAASVFKGKTHGTIGSADCLTCHNPHGGTDKALLK